MKYLLTLVALLLLTPGTVSAQYDKIYLKDGAVIKGTVKNMNWRVVVISNDEWRRNKNISRSDVHHIRYSDGTADTFSRHPIVYAGEALPLQGKNILMGIPVSGLACNTDGYFGIGLFYERLISKNNDVGIIVPLTFCFGEVDFKGFQGILTTPGFVFHTNLNKRADFSFGPSVLLTNVGYDVPHKITTGPLLNLRLTARKAAVVFCVNNSFGFTFGERGRKPVYFQLGISVGGIF